MPRDPLDFRHMLKPLLQRRIILQLPPLGSRLDVRAAGGLRAPEPDITVVTAAQHVVAVGCEGAAEDALHALRVVDVAAVALATPPEPHAAVITRGDELFACWTECHVHYRGDVVFEDVERAAQIARVEEVDVVVFVCDGEVEGFHGVPAYGIGGEGEDGAVQGRGCAEVVEDEAAVGCCGGEDAGFSLIEREGGDGVDAGRPGEGLDRSRGGSSDVVEGNLRGGDGKDGLGPMPRYAAVGILAEPAGDRGAVGGCVVGIEEFDGFIATAGEELSVLRPADAFDEVVVSFRLPDFVLTGEIPDFDYAISAGACKSVKGLGVFG